MVKTEIRGGELDIWADAPYKEALFDVVETVLDDSADEVTIFRAEFSTNSNNTEEYRMKLFFDVVTDGLFVGKSVANKLQEELQDFEGSQKAYYTKSSEEEVEEYR